MTMHTELWALEYFKQAGRLGTLVGGLGGAALGGLAGSALGDYQTQSATDSLGHAEQAVADANRGFTSTPLGDPTTFAPLNPHAPLQVVGDVEPAAVPHRGPLPTEQAIANLGGADFNLHDAVNRAPVLTGGGAAAGALAGGALGNRLTSRPKVATALLLDYFKMANLGLVRPLPADMHAVPGTNLNTLAGNGLKVRTRPNVKPQFTNESSGSLQTVGIKPGVAPGVPAKIADAFAFFYA